MQKKPLVRGAKITVRLPKWLSKKLGLATLELEGEAKAVTEKAVLFSGGAAIREERYCMRCSKEITHPVSLLLGYGPDCCAYLGIPRPQLEQLEPGQIDEIRREVLKRTHIETWLPRSKCNFKVLESPDSVPDRRPEVMPDGWKNEF